MQRRRTILARITASTLAAVPAAALAQDGLPLHDVAALAKVRAERQLPAQLAALEPYLADLRTDYRRNGEVLDRVIEKLVALGDAIVPALIEFLSPVGGEPSARFLAENAARVLQRLTPEVQFTTWLELAQGDEPVSRRLGLRLLGAAGDPRAVPVLTRVYSSLADPADRLAALDAAEQLGTPSLAHKVVPMLQSSDAERR